KIEFPVHEFPPMFGRLSTNDRQKRAAITLLRDRQSKPFQYRGHEIDRLCESFHKLSLPFRCLRIAHYEWNVIAGVEVPSFVPQPVLAQLFSVIAGEYNKGVVIHS